jgi:pimeloyl-ACP methyl ester carboxylesterase
MPPHPYNYRGETETLDEAARAALPGQFVALPDGVVHYELAGPPGGPVVVLVPGISVPYTTWDANFPALANAGLRVLRFDLYGRGYSDRPDVVYDIDLFDRQITNLLSALRLSDPISLVGLSMGGAVVTHFAARRPERVRRLVLIDPLSATPAATLPIKMVLVPGLGERLMDWLGNRILVGGQSQDFHRSELVAEFQEKYRPPMKYRGFKNAILSTVRSIPGWRIAEAYEQVGRAQYPVLLFWGRQDRAIPFETHRRVQAVIPRAEFHAIDNAGHVPHVEQPGALNPLLIEFLCRD